MSKLILFTSITSIATKLFIGYKQTAKLNKIYLSQNCIGFKLYSYK